MNTTAKLIHCRRTRGTETIHVSLEPKKGEEQYVVLLLELSGNAQITVVSHQNHAEPQAMSDFLCKAILSDTAQFFYEGTITIAKPAQKSHAYQRNENLLLSDESSARSEPKLEIEANDVFCTHGVATSPIDESQLWYLSSRGMKKERAITLIAEGFLQAGIDRLMRAGVPYQKEEK